MNPMPPTGRRRRPVRWLVVPGLAAVLSGCGGGSGPDAGAASSTPVLVDVAGDVGLSFHHVAGATGEFLFPEINGAGGAFIDYDDDGDLDVYLVQGGRLRPDGAASADLVPVPPATPRGNRLYRNDLGADGRFRLVDVTAQAGVGDEGYGMGVATGDIDNDGDIDLYVTNVGANVLYRNDGGGAFTDITARAGVADPRWSSSAAFADYDGDGDLDLFVNAYVDWSVDSNHVCRDDAGRTDYCAPAQYPPLADRLYRNEGDGRFVDVSEASGIASGFGPGLGVLASDFDGDGRVDLFVANDQSANFLWRNRGDGTFEETGLMAGVAYNADGAAEASMGVTAGDIDADGDDDLFMTHLTTQTNTLYVNDGSGVFTDSTTRSGLGGASLRMTGFGAGFLDVDNDGDLDLFAANGAVAAVAAQAATSAYPYTQPNQLFVNDGAGRFTEAAAGTGGNDVDALVSRGAAFGDVDNDGDTDILVTNNNGPARLLINRTDGGRWLRLVLKRSAADVRGTGARVGVESAGGTIVWRSARTDGSYLSGNDPRVLVGLGD